MYVYLKFGSLKDMTDLLENGTIYCKEIAYFSKQSDGCRYDDYELVTDMEYFEGGKLTLSPIDNPEKKVDIDVTTLQMKGSISDPVDNLFCLFALALEDEPEGYEFHLDEKLHEFGTHFVFIHNSAEFSNRLLEKLKKDNIEIVRSIVKYKDLTTYTGKKDFFTKPLAYAHQQEFRYHLKTGKTEPHIFSIDSIKDIAEIFETKRVPKFTKKQNL